MHGWGYHGRGASVRVECPADPVVPDCVQGWNLCQSTTGVRTHPQILILAGRPAGKGSLHFHSHRRSVAWRMTSDLVAKIGHAGVPQQFGTSRSRLSESCTAVPVEQTSQKLQSCS